jgi:hypothetical protein
VRPKSHVLAWVHLERSQHANTKYADGLEARNRLIEAMQEGGFHADWERFIESYLDRVRLVGLDTPQGRQAMGKAIVTMMHCLETAVECFGEMPMPGTPSGTVQEWH